MSDDYGKRLGMAIEAVAMLQSDVSRLFKEIHNDEFRGYESVFDSYCTRGLSRDYKRPRWMPKAVYRYYRDAKASPLVEGVTVVFRSDSGRIDEPIFIAFQLNYRRMPSGDPRKCKGWDVYDLYIDEDEFIPSGEVVVRRFGIEEPSGKRYEWAKLAAVPVYSVRNREEVKELIRAVRDTPAA